ncbi:MAG: ankyrin repeat domain-containing protein [Bacteroidales bacterium]|nr:ankyrin repeat domain-containing protein [Bacteroidales bacterium]
MVKKMLSMLFSFCLLLGCQTSFTQNESANETQLIKAIRARDINTVKSLIDKGADVNEASNYFTTPLDAAIETNQLEIVKILIEHGASDRTGLSTAVRDGNIKMAEYLLQQDFTIGSSLVNAAENNNMEMVRLLVEHGADVNLSQKRRNALLLPKYYVSPIEMAVKNNNKEMTLYLIDHGVPLETALDEAFIKGKNDLTKSLVDRSKDINSCFHKAFRAGNMEIIQYCIEKGADKNSRDATGKTILLLAAESGNIENIKFCIETLKLNPHDVSASKETALMLAAKTGNIATLNYLLDLGITLEAENNMGETAVFYALEADNDKAFQFLVQQKANIKHIAKDKSTLLIKAAHEEQADVMEYLLNSGLPVNAKNNKGESAFQIVISAFFKNDKLIDLMIEKGADLETKDERGRTLLFMEAEDDHLEKVKSLHARGANVDTRDKKNNRPGVRSASIARYLIDNGADINASDSRHDTYMCLALDLNDLELAQYLVNKGIDINQNCYFDEPPLIKAIEKESMSFIHFLVENNANINAKGYFGKTVMDYANNRGNAEIISYLKNPDAGIATSDVPLNDVDIEKKLEQATNNKQVDEVERILKENKPAELNEDLVKRIASLGAAEGRLYLVDFALKNLGLKVNDPVNLNNQTLLIISAEHQKINAVNYLLDKGANKNHKDYYNKTALDYSTDEEIKRILK